MADSSGGVSRERAIGITVLAVVVVFLAFLPWGRISVTQQLFDGAILGGDIRMKVVPEVVLDGWSGYISPLGFEIPNALVVLAAVVLALLCWLARAGVFSAPGWILVVLVAYGIGHVGRIVTALAGSSEGSVGIAGVLALGCWIGMAVVLARTRPADAPGGS